MSTFFTHVEGLDEVKDEVRELKESIEQGNVTNTGQFLDGLEKIERKLRYVWVYVDEVVEHKQKT